MHARTILILSLAILCMIGASKTIKPRKHLQQSPQFEQAKQQPVQSQRGVVAITTELVVNGLSRPLQVVAPPNDFDRIFIVEQYSGGIGRIKIFNLNTNTLNATPFLSIQVGIAFEQGLLGLAFHPNYAQNGYFYINYTNNFGDTVIARYTVSANPDIADASSATTIMTFGQPYENHNGGWISFGPDGYLYIATGDGGSGGDPGNRSQDITNQKLGKMLRIDVDGGTPYAIPPSNPFVGITGDDEIWSYGLRNPWRCSFDSLTGDLWIGDVGQNSWEEVSFQPATSTGGDNYGWRCYEGNHPFNTSGCPPQNTTVSPVWEYSTHTVGCSLTGGEVYRGSAIPTLRGTYFFGDWCNAKIWSFRYDGSVMTEYQDRTAELHPPGVLSINFITSFGHDAAGEMYICDMGGEVFRVVPVNPILCPEDINLDGNINTNDLLAVIGNWGPCMGCAADINGDGNVDITDLLAVIGNWGSCP